MTKAAIQTRAQLIVRLYRAGSTYASLCRRYGRLAVDKAIRGAL